MAQRRVLVTGATGFVGPRLLKALRQGGFSSADFLVWDHNAHEPPSQVNVNICNSQAVDASIAAFKPTHVVHLAAQSHVPTSFAKPELTWQVNVMGTLYLFEALKRHVPQAVVLFISSAEVYGKSFSHGSALGEEAPLQPMNPYAASKAAADIMAGQYACLGMQVIRLRPFNHIGVGQREEFVASAFAAQIARIEAGLQPPVIRVGNLEAQRDFLDVDDVVRAYALALEHGERLEPGVIFNLCRERAYRIGDLLNLLLQMCAVEIAVEQDPSRMRPSDIPAALGCAEKARELLNWQVSIPLEQTLRDLLDDWREHVAQSSKGSGSCK